MYRIDLAHLCWSLENLAAGTPVNVIEVDDGDGAMVAGGAGADACDREGGLGTRAHVPASSIFRIRVPQSPQVSSLNPEVPVHLVVASVFKTAEEFSRRRSRTITSDFGA